jgi:outer membrane receptor for ferrienterochelin and colicins
MVFGNRQGDGTRATTVASAGRRAGAAVQRHAHRQRQPLHAGATQPASGAAALASGLATGGNGGGVSQGRGRQPVAAQFETRSSGPAADRRATAADTRDRTLLLTGKASKLLDSDHSLVSGAEIERVTRSETFVRNLSGSAGDGGPAADTDGDLQAQSQRLALYAQDEWALTPHWAVHAGLRWEGIRTRSDRSDNSRTDNRSSVLSPLLHAVWKPDPKARDQIRVSLTRSYKPPTLQSLVARPRESLGVNSPTNPDRNGNPDLKPELATGIDIAFERYLPQGGVLSANVFHRQIRDYIRSTAELQAVTGGICCSRATAAAR